MCCCVTLASNLNCTVIPSYFCQTFVCQESVLEGESAVAFAAIGVVLVVEEVERTVVAVAVVVVVPFPFALDHCFAAKMVLG